MVVVHLKLHVGYTPQVDGEGVSVGSLSEEKVATVVLVIFATRVKKCKAESGN